MYLFVIGPKGAGKTTLGVLLSHLQGVPHYSMGAILRSWKAGDTITPEGIYTKDFRGGSGGVAWRVLQQVFRKAPQGFILDGFPRYTDQLARLLASLRSRGKPFYFVAVHASPEVRLQRVLERAREGDRLESLPYYNQGLEDMLARQNLLYRLETNGYAPEFSASLVADVLIEKGVCRSL